MAIKAVLAFGLQKSVGCLWKGDDFSDFTVVVEETSFQCHRFVLSACSGFFQGLFRSQMKECQENSVNIGGMTASTFDVIINSLYTGLSGLTKDNVLDVWSGAVQLQIEYLIAHCERFVQKKISVNNCFMILRSAYMFSAQKVVDHSIEFILKHFEKIRNTESLLQVPYDYFYRVIESNFLIASSEDVVVETVIKWVEYTPSVRQCSCVSTQCTATDCSKNSMENDHTRRYIMKTDDASGNILETEDTSRTNFVTDDMKKPSLETDDTSINDAEIDDTISSKFKTDEDITSNIETNDMKRDTVEKNETFKRKADNNVDENNDIDPACDNLPVSLCMSGSQKEIKVDQAETLFVTEISQTGGLTDYGKNIDKTKSVMTILKVCDNCSEVKTDETDRKQHLFKLISACRVFLLSPTYLENLLRNCKLLLSCREVYNLIVDAVMYQWHVERRDDSWPEAAVYRWASSMKHVMVFVCSNKIMAYNLNTGSMHEFVNVPEKWQSKTIHVFDNSLYLQFEDENEKIYLSMYEQEKSWKHVLCTKTYTELLAHGSHIYGLSGCDLDRMLIKYGHKLKWSSCCKLDTPGDVLIRYQKYILIFCTEDDIITAQCYNTETNTVHKSESMDGTYKGIASFSHLGDVYLLQKNGSLWKIVSSGTGPIDFELITKLWDLDYDLRGCVVYRKELFVFCQDKESETSRCLISLPGIFKNIKLVTVNSDSPCLPMVMSKSQFSK